MFCFIGYSGISWFVFSRHLLWSCSSLKWPKARPDSRPVLARSGPIGLFRVRRPVSERLYKPSPDCLLLEAVQGFLPHACRSRLLLYTHVPKTACTTTLASALGEGFICTFLWTVDSLFVHLMEQECLLLCRFVFFLMSLLTCSCWCHSARFYLRLVLGVSVCVWVCVCVATCSMTVFWHRNYM